MTPPRFHTLHTLADAKTTLQSPIAFPRIRTEVHAKTPGTLHMKVRLLASLAAMALAGMGAAVAQTQTIEDYVRGLITENVEPGERLIGRVEIRELEEGDETWLVFNLDEDKSYFVYGACDDDCSDIDLTAEDGDGHQVDSDEQDDDAPVLLISSGEAGDELHVRASMATCEADVCVLGVGLYETES